MGIFHPYGLKRKKELETNGTRFVHYTNADAAMSILQNKEYWMRKSSCMSDYMEVQHGLKCLYSAYKKRFKLVLDGIFTNFSTVIEKPFNDWTPYFQTDTYFTCISEHKNEEDTYGRLSMWRAYGEASGVAFVLNNGDFLNPSDPIDGIFSYPVDYLNDQGVEERLNTIADNISANLDFIRQQGPDIIANWVFQTLRVMALCTKHPGFSEEKEWRIIFSPRLDKSTRVTKAIRNVKGGLQPVYTVPLRNIPTLINRIIIGPTQYPWAAQEAFIDLLTMVGVIDAAKKVFVSDIPLRR